MKIKNALETHGIRAEQRTIQPTLPVLPHLTRSFYNEFGLFYYFYEKIPNKISETDIDVNAARLWFLDAYGGEVVDHFFLKSCYANSETAILDDAIYRLQIDLIVYFDIQWSIIRYLFKDTPIAFVENLVAELNAFKIKPNQESEIHLLIDGRFSSYSLEKFKLPEQSFCLTDYYNDDFAPVHQEILFRLNQPKDKGIVLLHGAPGTGKTSYIRQLTKLVNKKVIFIPPNMAEGLTNPSFLPLLMENPDSILVIEDAESILLDRNFKDKSAVSALLNLSDGLLSDCLSIQLICTFNTDVTKIDSALLRKGRLIASYKFGPLDQNKAQELSRKLGNSASIEQPMRLADIFNQKPIPVSATSERAIGFGTGRN